MMTFRTGLRGVNHQLPATADLLKKKLIHLQLPAHIMAIHNIQPVGHVGIGDADHHRAPSKVKCHRESAVGNGNIFGRGRRSRESGVHKPDIGVGIGNISRSGRRRPSVVGGTGFRLGGGKKHHG